MNLAVAIGKLLRSSIRLFRRGGGSALPGLIAGRIDPGLIERSFQFSRGVVVVTGSAGKSSTTKMLSAILEAHGLRVFTNPSTANIEQGLISSILQQSDLAGRLPFDIAVLEVDEGHGALLAKRLRPQLSVFTNLMVDQLDRFVDPDRVLEKLELIARASNAILVNADDANLDSLGEAGSFGSARNLWVRPDYPSYAPVFAEPKRSPGLVISALTDREASFEFAGTSHQLRLPSPGMHVALNAAAAMLAASEILAEEFDPARACAVISQSQPVFARDENLSVNGVSVRLMLVQNPGSFRLNLALLGTPERLMIAIGSDVHDPSWLWSVDFSGLDRVHLVSGSNANELALRLAYQGIEVERVDAAVEAVDSFLELSKGASATILLSADSMRRIRRHLRLAK
jgi:lipid II isoglutaminyl synthase (glutamine-hydrolysing)